MSFFDYVQLLSEIQSLLQNIPKNHNEVVEFLKKFSEVDTRFPKNNFESMLNSANIILFEIGHKMQLPSKFQPYDYFPTRIELNPFDFQEVYKFDKKLISLLKQILSFVSDLELKDAILSYLEFGDNIDSLRTLFSKMLEKVALKNVSISFDEPHVSNKLRKEILVRTTRKYSLSLIKLLPLREALLNSSLSKSDKDKVKNASDGEIIEFAYYILHEQTIPLSNNLCKIDGYDKARVTLKNLYEKNRSYEHLLIVFDIYIELSDKMSSFDMLENEAYVNGSLDKKVSFALNFILQQEMIKIRAKVALDLLTTHGLDQPFGEFGITYFIERGVMPDISNNEDIRHSKDNRLNRYLELCDDTSNQPISELLSCISFIVNDVACTLPQFLEQYQEMVEAQLTEMLGIGRSI